MDLSEKELSVIQDLLNEEELLVKKFQMLAEHSQDETIKQQMLDLTMNEVYTEKEILGDALNSEKNATTLYNLGANECVHDNLRETMLDLLAKEHDIQVDVFNQMHTMGYYPTPAAEAKKVQEAKTKFECGFKAV